MMFNRGLVPRATDPTERRRDLVLVQAKDAEGFWCNVVEPLTVKAAVVMASALLSEYSETRVVMGPKREVIRVFSA